MSILIHRRRLGHNFCRGCLDKISASAKGPACPLCREPFNTQSIRLIRVDLCDPLPPLSYDNFPISDETDSDLSDRARSPWNYDARIRDEARILELKVAKAASTKCTFDEVSDLHKEIQDWLLTDVRYKPNGKVSQTLALARPPCGVYQLHRPPYGSDCSLCAPPTCWAYAHFVCITKSASLDPERQSAGDTIQAQCPLAYSSVAAAPE